MDKVASVARASRLWGSAWLVITHFLTATAVGEESRLSDYFGFQPLEVVKIDANAGPILAADVDGDGLNDLIAVNNFKSRIELHLQRPGAKPDDEPAPSLEANELPEHWRFRRQNISVSHKVNAVLAYDYDHDGVTDLIFAGSPPEIVFVRQTSPGVFDIARRHSIKGLDAGANSFEIKDVIGDDKPELLAMVGGEVHIWPLDGNSLGTPVKLVSGERMVAFFVEDYNGDGRQDVAGVIPDDAAPLRIWLGGVDEGVGVLGAQVRFEMPPLREFEPVRLPGQAAANFAVIERPSKRIVVNRLVTEKVGEEGDRDASMRVFSFTDPGNRKRSLAVADADGDGLLDLIATDTEANAVVVYRQIPGKGLQPGESYPTFSEVGQITAMNVDADPSAELFVLSEKEGVVGRSDLSRGSVPFPSPIKIGSNRTPVALNVVELESGPHVAVVAKESRNFFIDLIDMNGQSKTIELGAQSRSPQTIIALDADQDGKTDLLLFTPEKPMTMLHAEDDGFKLRESKDMGQFGLVQNATADNTAVFDIDGDGRKELLIADKNFVRAVRYEDQPAPGVSPGWQVVTQINAKDGSSKLVSLTPLGDRIVAADRENSRLIVMERSGADSATPWREVESLKVKGFGFNSIHAGAFSGDGRQNILAVGGDGFAVIELGGERVALDEVAAWRTDKERRVQHELGVGDINSDGFTDMVSLDAGEQMFEIFTFTEADRMLFATAFPIFESKIFSGGEPKEFEPRQIVIADVTGDQAADILLLAHDRVLIYPQMTAPAAKTP